MRAIIIGGTSGLGRALAEEFISSGWEVTVTGVHEAAIKGFSSAHPDAEVLKLDLSETEGREAADALMSGAKELDAVAVCAGLYEDNPSADWPAEERAIAVNAAGCAAALNSAYRCFLKRGKGRLACVTSIGGVRGNARCPAYNASKAFLFNYLEGLRQNAAAAGSPVTVTNIVPAYIGNGEGWGKIMLSAILDGRRETYIPGYWRWLAAAYRNLPAMLHQNMHRWHYILLKPFMRRPPRWQEKK